MHAGNGLPLCPDGLSAQAFEPILGTRAMRLYLAWLLAASLSLALGSSAPPAAEAAGADIVGAATVLVDGSLRINTSIVRLYGIYIPPSGQRCVFFQRPALCASRGALALETRIQGFVFCDSVDRNGDGSVNAVCFIRRTFVSQGEDLAAFLLAEGLAVSLPGAPFEYLALERIAQTRQLGIWGFPVDVIIRDRRRPR
jgi:endonuclease YncB( thermonuclease family)